MARFLNSPSVSRQKYEASSNTTGTEVTFPEPRFFHSNIYVGPHIKLSTLPFTLLNPTMWFFSASL